MNQVKRKTINVTSIESDTQLSLSCGNPFETEIALYEKERHLSDITATVAVPDFYHIAFPNLGHQIVEKQLNDTPGYYADRAYLDHDYSLLKENPHVKPEVIFVSMSYEGSYIRALRLVEQMGVPLRKNDRKEGDPLVVFGGWSISRNPLPLFEFADVIGVGDAEYIINEIAKAYRENRTSRERVFDRLVNNRGIIIPSRYKVETENGYLIKWEAKNAPIDIFPSESTIFPHSWYLSSETDYNEIGYYSGKTFFSMQIVDACGSKCNFCASGYKNKVRDIRDPIQVADLGEWAATYGADLVKLLFPANSSLTATKAIMQELLERGLSPRVGSAKAEKIDFEYIQLVGKAGQEKIAFAPETGDYELRKRLGKPGMTDQVLERVITESILAGIPNLDFYLIMNLPGEAPDSFDKTINLLGEFYNLAKKKGLPGRVRISAPNFFPKAGTPFQYAASGAIDLYLEKVAVLEKNLGATVKVSSMKGSVDLLSQNILARGGVETGELMIAVHKKLQIREAKTGIYTPDTLEDWREAMTELDLDEHAYFDQKDTKKPLPWQYIHISDKTEHALIKAWEVFQGKRALFVTK